MPKNQQSHLSQVLQKGLLHWSGQDGRKTLTQTALMGMRLASSRQPFLCGFFCAVGGQWSSWEELSHWSPCHFHYKANDLESVRWPTGWAVGRIGEDHPWLSPVPGALPGLLTCTAPVFSCPLVNSSCLGASPGLFRFLFLFCPNQKVEKKIPSVLFIFSKQIITNF